MKRNWESCSKGFSKESKDEADVEREICGQIKDSSENFLSRCHLIENSESESSASTIETSDCALEVHDNADVVQVSNSYDNKKEERSRADGLVSLNKICSIDMLPKLSNDMTKNIGLEIDLKPQFKPTEASNQVSLNNEATKDTPRSLMSCRFCRGEFNSLEEFQSHTCDNKICSSSEKLHKCKLCSSSFPKLYLLNRHLKGHYRNTCNFCNSQCAKRKALIEHLKDAHNVSAPEQLHSCKICDKQFSKRESLNAHLKNHADGQNLCMKCGFMCANESDYNDHVADHIKEYKFECKLCDKKFARKQQHDQHMMGHERHVCALCSATFSTKRLLLKHRQAVHGGWSSEAHIIVKKHECAICKKSFARLKHLQYHQRVHTGEKPFNCQHCEWSFSNERALAKHMKTVTHLQKVGAEGKVVEIEKRFLCEECGSRFYRRQSLVRHAETIHTSSATYKCDHCDYNTKSKANLKRHSNLHTDNKRYVCEICGSSFRAFATLREHHAFVHSDNRKFICETCNKGFKSKSDLQRHLRIHSESRPYKCHCNKAYKRLSHLKRHMISAHPMTLENSLISGENSSDIDTSSQDSSQPFIYPVSLFQNTLESNNNMILPDSCSFDAGDLTEISNDKDTISSTSIAKSYSNIPFIDKDNVHVLAESNTKSSLVTILSPIKLEVQNTSEHNHYVNLSDCCSLDAEDLTETSKDRDSISSVSIAEGYSNIPFIDKGNVNALTESNTKSSLVTILSTVKIDGGNSNSITDENSILDDLNLNMSSNSYFNLTSSPLNATNMDCVPSTMQHITSQDVLTFSSGQDHLVRPQSLPNLNFQTQSDMDPLGSFSLDNSDSPNTISLSPFLLNTEMSSAQVSNINMEQNDSKHLFGGTDDILSFPPYTSSTQLNISDCASDQFFNSPKTSDIWDDENRLKLSDDDVMSNSCGNINLNSFSSNISSPNSLLSHNLIFSNESLMSSHIDTNSINSDFESLSNLC